MPYYQKLGEMPRKHHIWFHRDGAGPGFKNEGIYYEHVVTTEGFNEAFSIMYHLRPPTRVRNVKLLEQCREQFVAVLLVTLAPPRGQAFQLLRVGLLK